jgi:hypothetical protein
MNIGASRIGPSALGRNADQLWVGEIVCIPDLLDSPLALLGKRKDVTLADPAGETREVCVLRLITVRVLEEQVVIDGVVHKGPPCNRAAPAPVGAGGGDACMPVVRRLRFPSRSRC